jgi:hypothetical protein
MATPVPSAIPMPSAIPVFVMCHPEHEKGRYEWLRSHLPARGIPLDRITYIHGLWGSELTAEQIFAAYDPFKKRLGLPYSVCYKSSALSRGEISLLLTFRKAVEAAIASGAPEVIIFESDVVLRPDFMNRLEQVLKGGAERDWDYISLGEGVGTRPPGRHGTSYFVPTELFTPPHQWVYRCCDSMLFRRGFLEKLLKTIVPFRECLDWEMNLQHMVHGGRALWADPPLVEPGSGRWREPSQLRG